MICVVSDIIDGVLLKYGKAASTSLEDLYA